MSHHILSCVSRQNTLPHSMSPTSHDQTGKDKFVAFLFFSLLSFPFLSLHTFSSYVFHIHIELLTLFISFSTYTLCCFAQSSHSQPFGLSLALFHGPCFLSQARRVYPIFFCLGLWHFLHEGYLVHSALVYFGRLWVLSIEKFIFKLDSRSLE